MVLLPKIFSRGSVVLFLLLSVPISLIAGFVAWMSWRARHRGVAFTMAGISIIFTGISLAIIIVGLFFYEALQTTPFG